MKRVSRFTRRKGHFACGFMLLLLSACSKEHVTSTLISHSSDDDLCRELGTHMLTSNLALQINDEILARRGINHSRCFALVRKGVIEGVKKSEYDVSSVPTRQ